MPVTILPGPMGTLLASRGVPTPPPGWSAHALQTHPDMVVSIHAEYAAAGVHLSIANTFRTQPRIFPDLWSALLWVGVALARTGAPRLPVAGSMAPVADCYRPDLSPPDARNTHRLMARELASAGCELLLCETFPNPGEALAAAEEAVATGKPTWLSLTAGPDGSLLTPEQVGAAVADAVRLGVRAVLINCTAATRTLPYVRALAEAAGGRVPFGAYANAGAAEDRCGMDDADGAERYADLAESWVNAGATLIGSCCGTGPAHTRALAARFASALAPLRF